MHDAAGRLNDRDAAVRAALALDPHRRRDARAGGALGRRGQRRRRSRNVDAPAAAARRRVSGARPLPRDEVRPGRIARDPVSGAGARDVGIPSALRADARSDRGRARAGAGRRVREVRPGRARGRSPAPRVRARSRATAARASGWRACWSQLGRRSEAAAELATLAGQLRRGGRRGRRAGRRARADAGPVLRRGGEAAGTRRSPRRPRPRRWPPRSATSCAAELEQVDFFLQQSLHDEARVGARRAGPALPGRSADRREARGDRARPSRRRRRAPSPATRARFPAAQRSPTIPHGPVAKLSVVRARGSRHARRPRHRLQADGPLRRRHRRVQAAAGGQGARGVRADDDRRMRRGEGGTGRGGWKVQGGA